MFMKNNFEKIPVKSITTNVFSMWDDAWTLISAGNIEHFNSMTASWGGFGVLWNKEIAIIFIRPQRFTYQFANQYDYFTLSFFDEQYRAVLDFCGSHSGRNVDKTKEMGLHTFATPMRNVGFEESALLLECKKIYTFDLLPEKFIDPNIQKNYPKNDYHRAFIGEILHCYRHV